MKVALSVVAIKEGMKPHGPCHFNSFVSALSAQSAVLPLDLLGRTDLASLAFLLLASSLSLSGPCT
jgi:hypothetical protein